MHNETTTNSKFVIDTPGRYTGGCTVAFDTNAVGIRRVRISKTSKSGVQTYIASDIRNATTALNCNVTIPFSLDFDHGDQIEVEVRQTSGGNLNVLMGTTVVAPAFWIQGISDYRDKENR